MQSAPENTRKRSPSGDSSDSSFHDEYSIFSRPLKDLPVLSTLDFQMDPVPPREESREEEKEVEEVLPQKSPFEWLMSFQMQDNLFLRGDKPGT